MGLDTSHGAWHGPYSAFNAFRKELARLAGFPPLDEMEGFGNFGTTQPGWRHWGTTTGDRRLIPLLHHSDCEGELSPAECSVIARALRDLMANHDLHRSAFPNFHFAAARFAEGCEAAAAAGEPLDFH